ncbi:MAG: FprA family A-type flavoprotein [Candidatus Aminicenantes bacterium]|nr:FprA family A-type flavoprotein [Candidatus Aminicenantes bacterium]
MPLRKIKEKIFSVGTIDWERRLFDELVPLPDGTSYNSYLILGNEKTALIDTVDPAKTHELINNLNNLGIKRIDYIIVNHAEQDHSGSISDVLELYPMAKVVANAKCKSMLMDLLHIPEDKFIVIEDRQELSLGDKTLEFILTPWVHWPETMVTFLKEDKILFSCDLFGSHFATSRLYANEDAKVLEDAKRYYAEIMMPFRLQIRKYLDWIEKLTPEIIAPSHGPLWKNPDFIIKAHREWVSDSLKNIVLIPYISMHHSTKQMAEYLADALVKRGIEASLFNLTVTDIGKFAIALVDAPTMVLGAPTVLAGTHPAAIYAAYLTNALRPKLKYVGIIGSYGWGGKAVDHIKAQLSTLKVELLNPVLIKGLPREEDFKKLDNLAEEILNKHKELGLI